MNVFREKQEQILNNFKEHCLKSLNATFDEIIKDFESLRTECLFYIEQQFKDAEIVLKDRSSNDETKTEIFSAPKMFLKMFTFPRNKIELRCEIFDGAFCATKNFSSRISSKEIKCRCRCGRISSNENQQIDAETEIEEFRHGNLHEKQIQTENFDEQKQEEENFPLTERLSSEQTIITERDVDRLGTDGKSTLIYFSETSRTISFLTEIENQHHETVFRWPNFPILDFAFSPTTKEFIAATKTDIFAISFDPNDHNGSVRVESKLKKFSSFVRLAADHRNIFLWADTPYYSQLEIYAPENFQLLQQFDLNEFQHFSPNTTSFFLNSNRLAVLFQFKHNSFYFEQENPQRFFRLAFFDRNSLDKTDDIFLGSCLIDHEIRSDQNGTFFITNGKRQLFIVEPDGNVEILRLNQDGRSIAVLSNNSVIIGNGTKELQFIKFS